MPEPTRTCGGCTACCKTHPVEAFGKLAGQRCQFQAHGKCRAYEVRPRSCRAFSCEWLKGYGTDEDRPDRTGIVLESVTDPSSGEKKEVCLWEATPGALSNRFAARITGEVHANDRPVHYKFLSGQRRILRPLSLPASSPS